jgi:hypothetical protein
MDCALIADRLIGYHFATCDEDERPRIEGHLLECATCLRAYLSLKRDVELGPGRGERPGPGVRERLRARVAAEFTPRPRARLLTRRIPLYQGLAAAALAAGLALVLPSLLRDRPGPRGGEADVDTRRPSPESLTIY